MLRFAPSSTGDIYINDLRIALFNYIISKQKKEDFLISIEETDKNILELLAIFDIEYSQVIYNGQNMRFHSAMALQLLHEKKAFSCFCSSEYLDKKQQEAKNMNKKYTYDDACRNLPAELVIDNTNPFTIRINKPDDNKSKLDAVDSFIILNQDKKPTQNFAIAVDDMLNDISLVVDEQEDTNNTLKQEYIRTSLGYGKKIKYIHIPPLLNEDKNNFSIKWLLSEGYLPAAISNYLISINNNNLPSDIFTLQDAIKWFKIDDISHSPALFSLELLRDINKIHLENLDAVELSRYVGFADANIGELAKVYLKEAKTTKELKSKIKPIFEPKKIPKEFLETSTKMIEIIRDAPYFQEYNDFKNYITKSLDIEDKDFVVSLRYLLTGNENGPDIQEIYKHLKNYIGEIIK